MIASPIFSFGRTVEEQVGSIAAQKCSSREIILQFLICNFA